MIGDVLEWVDRQPFVVIVAALLCWILLRVSVIYGVGRGARAQRLGPRLNALARSPHIARAERIWSRVGLPILPLSFLVPGLLFATQLTAGLLRTPVRR